ncbi:MAG TPA: haloacid dehalogenase, partial [Alphaproteobacteria bacterium]|nr:haloacid dehalogenase [Alphaproteobacteria bacterium]
MSRQALVIFDCDGTLVDSAAMIVDTAQRAFTIAELRAPRREAVLAATGLSLP